MKDIKHIRRDFHLAAWVTPQGWDLGVPGGVARSKSFSPKFNQIWCVSYLHEWHMQRHHFWGPRPLGPWGGAKRSNIIKSELQSQFQRFLNLLTNERYISDGIFIRPPGSGPGVGPGGTVGGGGGWRANSFSEIKPDLVC